MPSDHPSSKPCQAMIPWKSPAIFSVADALARRAAAFGLRFKKLVEAHRYACACSSRITKSRISASGLDQRRNVSGRTGETPVSSCTRARSSAALPIGASRGKLANPTTTQEPRVGSARHSCSSDHVDLHVALVRGGPNQAVPGVRSPSDPVCARARLVGSATSSRRKVNLDGRPVT
jgi:hypothetical protein